jgi:hypothetical protein
MSVRPVITERGRPTVYGHYGSQEATTVGHRRMVVRGSSMGSARVLLIFVVVRYSVEGCR